MQFLISIYFHKTYLFLFAIFCGSMPYCVFLIYKIKTIIKLINWRNKAKKGIIFSVTIEGIQDFFPSAILFLFNIKMVVVIIENRDTPGYMHRILSVRTLSGIKGGVEREGLTFSMPHSNSGAFLEKCEIGFCVWHICCVASCFSVSCQLPNLNSISPGY